MSQPKPFPYEDLLHLPYPRPTKRARMSMVERAAQFAPFAALTGYDSAIQETARLTDAKVELDESEKAALDEKLQQLLPLLPSAPTVSVTHFVRDDRKDGGMYITTLGILRKIDFYRCCLVVDQLTIPIDGVLRLECPQLHD